MKQALLTIQAKLILAIIIIIIIFNFSVEIDSQADEILASER